jgi:hypothetical protein
MVAACHCIHEKGEAMPDKQSTSTYRTQFGKLPEQPTVTTPAHRHAKAFLDAERARTATQPGLGMAGLLAVVPVALLFAFGLGGAEDSVVVLSPLVTFALPPLTVIAFWWEDWPGSSLRPKWSACVDTLLIAAAGIALAVAGQRVIGHVDAAGIFDPTPGPGHSPLYPASLPLGLAAFTAILQLTLAFEGWPLKRLPRLVGGIAALALSWAVALLVQYVAYDFPAPPDSGLFSQSGPFSREDISVVLAVCGSWQVWLFIVWRGWPMNALRKRWLRIVVGNVLVLGGAALTYALAHGAGGVELPAVLAAATSFSAAGLLVGMLFEGALRPYLSAAWERVAALAVTVALGAGLCTGLLAYANTLTWSTSSAEAWVGHASINALALGVILHVAVCHRWPLDDKTSALRQSEAPEQ